MTRNIQRLFVLRSEATVAMALFVGICLRQLTSAQVLPPLDVTASQPIYNSDGVTPLHGNNPYAGAFGYSVVTGCLVQILHAGANAVADPLDQNGNPTGDDAVIGTTTIGSGIAPEQTLSGRFSTSLYPPPAPGSRLYARVFNAATLAGATRYAQSALFTVSGVAVFDVSALGLTATVAQAMCVVTGRVELEGFQGSSRLVTFVASSEAGPLRTNALALPFSSGKAAYAVTVPTNTTFLSAKTAWHLRRRLPDTFASGLVAMNFLLAGGDCDDSNGVDLDDLDLLALNWYLDVWNPPYANAQADVDGNGVVDLDDLDIVARRWYETGDPP